MFILLINTFLGPCNTLGNPKYEVPTNGFYLEKLTKLLSTESFLHPAPLLDH